MKKYSLGITKLGLLFIVILFMGTVITAKAGAQSSSWNQGWSVFPFTIPSFFGPYDFGPADYQNWGLGQYQTWSYPISNQPVIPTNTNNWSMPSYSGLNYFPQFQTNWWSQPSTVNYNWQDYGESSSSINSGRTASCYFDLFDLTRGWTRDISEYDFSRPAIGHGIIDPEIYNQEPVIVPSQVQESVR